MANAGFIPLSRPLPNFCFTNALQKPQRWSLHGKRHSIHDLVHSITMDAFTSDPTARIYAATLPGGQGSVCWTYALMTPCFLSWRQIVGTCPRARNFPPALMEVGAHHACLWSCPQRKLPQGQKTREHCKQWFHENWTDKSCATYGRSLRLLMLEAAATSPGWRPTTHLANGPWKKKFELYFPY